MRADQARSGGIADRGPRYAGAVALGLYLLLSVAFFGLGVVGHLDSRSIGHGEDPGLFMWALKWWPQSIAEGWNPLHSDVVYAPQGWDLTWMTGLPGPSLVLAPLTQTVGPIATYNVLALLIPAANAFAAFLLCRSLGAGYWPSVAGGYLFGFSSYVLAQEVGGHPNLALVACIPLAGYLIVRRFGGTLGPRAFVAALTATLTFQYLTSTEVFLTLVMFGTLMLVLAVVAFADRRPVIWANTKLVVLSLVFTGLLVSPFLISALTTTETLATVYGDISTDPVNFLIPAEVTAVGGEAFESVSSRFVADVAEQGAYLGLPLVLIAVLFWRERRDRFATVMVIGSLVALIATLGPYLNLLGSVSSVRLPWVVFLNLPIFEYILPVRLIVYVWLLVAIMAALWLSAGSRRRWALGALAIVFILPNPFVEVSGTFRQPLAEGEESPWSWPRPVPPFFRSPEQRAVLEDQGNVLILPYHYNADSVHWQAEANMDFQMAGGYIGQASPDEYTCWPVFRSLVDGEYRADQRQDLIEFLRAKQVGSVLVREDHVDTAAPLLRALPGESRELGGMRVYELGEAFTRGDAPDCPTAAP